ncbi:MAG: 30S ribosomal protein S2 [Candidatus Kerfeldbacteria bacterium]
MKEITLLEMLKSGVHFGHQQRYWHPKMKPYIHTNRAGLYIIDLEKTDQKLKEATAFVKKIASENGKILFVSTKRQAQSIIKEAAQEVKMPFITERWIGGILTNFDIIKKLSLRLKYLRKQVDAGELDKYTKREKLKFTEEIEELTVLVGGIEDMDKKPQALFVIDIKKEKTAIREATNQKIPIIAMVDTNVNPELVDYPIPANDDATKSIKLIVSVIKDAIIEGASMKKEKEASKKDEKPSK